jgi:hypothetical protein
MSQINMNVALIVIASTVTNLIQFKQAKNSLHRVHTIVSSDSQTFITWNENLNHNSVLVPENQNIHNKKHKSQQLDIDCPKANFYDQRKKLTHFLIRVATYKNL